MLADMTEDNVELTFDRVFMIGLDDDDVQVRAQSIKALWEYESDDLAPDADRACSTTRKRSCAARRRSASGAS